MSDQYVQQNSGEGTTTVVVTLNSVVAGNTIVAYLFNGSTGNIPTSVADGQGSYAGGADARDSGNFVWGKAFTLANANAGTHTITGTVTSGSSCYMMVVEIGAATTSPISDTKGQFQSNPGTGTDAISSTSATVTGAATLVGFSTDSNSTSTSNEPTAGTGFSSRANNANTTIGAWRLETKAVSANAAATFTAPTGTDTFVTLAVAVLNPVVTVSATGSIDLDPRRNRPGRGPYSLGRYFRPIGETASPPTAQTYNVSAVETLTFSDSQTVAMTAPEDVAETLAFSDSQSAAMTAPEAVTEAVTFSDSQTGVIALLADTTESITFSDSQTATAAFASVIAEALTFSDSQTVAMAAPEAVAETLTLSDSQDATTGPNTYAVSVLEVLSFSDSQAATNSGDSAQVFGGGWTMAYKKKKEEVDRLRDDLAAAIEALQPRPKVEIPKENSEFTPEVYVPKDVYAEMQRAQAVAEDTIEWLTHMRKAVVRARQKRAVIDMLLYGD